MTLRPASEPCRPSEEHEAFAVHTFGERAGVVLTCEHASERLPGSFAAETSFAWPEADQWLRGTHWALDLGAEAIALEHAEAIGARLVRARFSRLLVDANRPLDSETLFRGVAEGRTIEMNRAIPARERDARIGLLYEPFHAAVDRAVEASDAAEIVFAVHTFTPLYEGQPRKVEVGVLFDHEEALADRVLRGLLLAGFDARPNEPWSGKDGLVHVAGRHAARHARRALELEVRQDLAVDPAFRARLVPILADLLH